MALQLKRGTRAKIDALALRGGLLEGEPLFITDESKVIVGNSAGGYSSASFSVSSSVSLSTLGIISFDLKREDFDSSFNTSTSQFTANASGTYYFGFSMLANPDRVGEYRIELFKNASQSLGVHGIRTIFNKATGFQTITGGGIIKLLKGDYVTLNCTTAPSGGKYFWEDANYNNFHGFLIG
jgi:hypothetical protein